MKYPLEVASIVRNQTFYINSILGVAKTSNEEAPFTVYDRYSRFLFCLINKDKKSAIANIPVREMMAIFKKSEYAYEKHLGFENKEEGLAYTVQFVSGQLKGLTPAQVFQQFGKEKLNEQYTWLKNHLETYPSNKRIMDAIEDVANRVKEGTLKEVSAGNKIELYSADLRPLRSRTREDGKSLVYQIHINWNIGQKYPVEIQITNYYAPVVTMEDGRLNVLVSERDSASVIDNTMSLTDTEWMQVMYQIETNMRMFEDLHAKEIWEDAINCDRKNRENAKAST